MWLRRYLLLLFGGGKFAPSPPVLGGTGFVTDFCHARGGAADFDHVREAAADFGHVRDATLEV